MLILRLQGWSLMELAFRYSCDKTSIRKACLRSGLPNDIILLPKPMVTLHQIYTDWNGERLNRGKGYKEYLEEKNHKATRVIFIRSSI